MPGANLNDIYESIGGLNSTVKALARQIAENEKRNVDAIKQANVSRTNMHRRLDEVVMRTTHLESDVGSVKNRIEDIEQVTEEVKAWKQRGVGALFVVGIASAALSGMIVHFWEALTRLFKV